MERTKEDDIMVQFIEVYNGLKSVSIEDTIAFLNNDELAITFALSGEVKF